MGPAICLKGPYFLHLFSPSFNLTVRGDGPERELDEMSHQSGGGIITNLDLSHLKGGYGFPFFPSGKGSGLDLPDVGCEKGVSINSFGSGHPDGVEGAHIFNMGRRYHVNHFGRTCGQCACRHRQRLFGWELLILLLSGWGEEEAIKGREI